MERQELNAKYGKIVADALERQDYKLLKVLKKDSRSEVYLIEIENRKYVYKIPIEKNKRAWQRLLSFVKGGESRKEYNNYLRILNNGFNGPAPILYWENVKYGFVVDSYLVTEYVEGKTAGIEDLDKISRELKRIHKKGFLHGDSQLPNFIIQNDKVFLIDAKLQRNIYFSLGRVYEFIYLEESCHRNIYVYSKTGISYKIAKALNLYLHWVGRTKKRFRGKE